MTRALKLVIGEFHGPFEILDGPKSSDNGVIWLARCRHCGDARYRTASSLVNRDGNCHCQSVYGLEHFIQQWDDADRVIDLPDDTPDESR
jgi:hypothetical protein